MSRVNDSQVLEIRPTEDTHKPPFLRVTTWRGYDKDTNTYRFLARSVWAIYDEKHELILASFDRKTNGVSELGPLPDQHKRLAREWARKKWGGSQYRRLKVVVP